MSDNPEDELELLTVEPPDADWTLILAHGAGQGADSPFMAHLRVLRTPMLICQGYPFTGIQEATEI